MPRTTKPTGGGKRYPLNMRTTLETRERLEAAASASGRSLVQEVEHRLELSFRVEEIERAREKAEKRLDILMALLDALARVDDPIRFLENAIARAVPDKAAEILEMARAEGEDQ